MYIISVILCSFQNNSSSPFLIPGYVLRIFLNFVYFSVLRSCKKFIKKSVIFYIHNTATDSSEPDRLGVRCETGERELYNVRCIVVINAHFSAFRIDSIHLVEIQFGSIVALVYIV